jgi:hypothetical protein
MNVWLEVFLTVFAVIGVWISLDEVVKFIFGNKNDEIYVYFTGEKAESGEWDAIISSPDEDRILKALGGEFGKIYVFRGVDRWSEKKNSSKEQSKK